MGGPPQFLVEVVSLNADLRLAAWFAIHLEVPVVDLLTKYAAPGKEEQCHNVISDWLRRCDRRYSILFD